MLRLILAAIHFGYGQLAVACDSKIAWPRLRLHGARIGKRLRVRGALNQMIHRTATVQIGDNCRIKSVFAENPVGGTAVEAYGSDATQSYRLVTE
jgi:hypothetical protein